MTFHKPRFSLSLSLAIYPHYQTAKYNKQPEVDISRNRNQISEKQGTCHNFLTKYAQSKKKLQLLKKYDKLLLLS